MAGVHGAGRCRVDGVGIAAGGVGRYAARVLVVVGLLLAAVGGWAIECEKGAALRRDVAALRSRLDAAGL